MSAITSLLCAAVTTTAACSGALFLALAGFFLHLRGMHLVEPRELLLEGALRRVLRARIEARVDAQPCFGEVFFAIVPAQGATNEIEIGGVVAAACCG